MLDAHHRLHRAHPAPLLEAAATPNHAFKRTRRFVRFGEHSELAIRECLRWETELHIVGRQHSECSCEHRTEVRDHAGYDC